MTQQEKQERLDSLHEQILEKEAYLNATDYQTIREVEGGEPMSDEVKSLRADARRAINNAQAEINLLDAAEVEDFVPVDNEE